MGFKICIDAGHYSKRNQSPVVLEYWESVQMWKLHLKLKRELEYFGFEVITTRPTLETDLPVYQRGQLAKGCDLFLSLHSDAIGITLNGSTTDRATVFAPFDNVNDSHELANDLAQAVEEVMGVSKGVVKTRKSEKGEYEYYGVLRGARSVNCPRYYLIEHSFHTNRNSAQWLLKDGNLDKLAEAEARTIAEYYGIVKPEKEKSEKTVNIELRQLEKGMKGQEVKTLQLLLIAQGYKMPKYGADGHYGNETKIAVESFQRINSLTVDAIVGKNTWNKLLKG